MGGVTECFDVAVADFVGFKTSTGHPLYRGLMRNFVDLKNVTSLFPSLKYRRLTVTKKFGSRMELKTF